MKTCTTILLAALAAVSPNCFAQPDFGFAGPMIGITSPANHATFYGPLDIPIFASVVDSPHTTNVEFYAGTNYLGSGINLGRVTRPPTYFMWATPVPRLASLWCLVWSNVPAGSYTLTAHNQGTNIQAFVDRYLSRTSAPVNITVIAPSVTNNGPDVVSVVATDPIAISGSNSWVWPGLTNANPAWTNWPPAHPVMFTNWGPKNALFTVRRFGDASGDLTVTYSLSGTATNGTHYAMLSGSVTIPAGSAYALIPVVPIDTGAPYLPRTVILTLNSGSNATPSYSLGIPRRAAVVILHDWVRPVVPEIYADGSFALNATGPDGAWFDVQTSSDVVNWTSAGTNQVFQGAINFVDMNAPSNVLQFYRTIPQSGPPGQ